MGVDVRAQYWYGVKLSYDDYEIIKRFKDIAEKEENDGEWNLNLPDDKWKCVNLKYYSYYDVLEDPIGIGVEIGSLGWGKVVTVSEMEFKLDPKIKEAADKILDELEVPGKRDIYVNMLMC